MNETYTIHTHAHTLIQYLLEHILLPSNLGSTLDYLSIHLPL